MQPGTRAAYHPYSSWFLLGEIVRRVDGRPFEVYARQEIFLPLGMPDCYVGMTRQDYDRYNEEGRFAELRTMNPKGKILPKATVGVLPKEVMAAVPGSNGRGSASQWVHLFEMLNNDGVGHTGTRILAAETVNKFTCRHRIGMYDVVQGILCDWSLGLFVRTGSGSQMCEPTRLLHAGLPIRYARALCQCTTPISLALSQKACPWHTHAPCARATRALRADYSPLPISSSIQKRADGCGDPPPAPPCTSAVLATTPAQTLSGTVARNHRWASATQCTN